MKALRVAGWLLSQAALFLTKSKQRIFTACHLSERCELRKSAILQQY